ncbi:MAG: hypothetical protein ACOYNR_09040 [Blastocatellia bacterium]
MNDRRLGLSAFYFLLPLWLVGCGGALYRIAPLPAGPALPSHSLGEVEGAATLRVGAAYYDGDESLRQFEANLPLTGVLAVEVHLLNRGGESADLSAMKIEVRGTRGERRPPLPPLTGDKALRRVMRAYGNRLYTIESHRATLARYREIELPVSGELSPGEERRGVLFFAIPPQAPLEETYTATVALGERKVEIPLPARPR